MENRSQFGKMGIENNRSMIRLGMSLEAWWKVNCHIWVYVTSEASLTPWSRDSQLLQDCLSWKNRIIQIKQKAGGKGIKTIFISLFLGNCNEVQLESNKINHLFLIRLIRSYLVFQFDTRTISEAFGFFDSP